MYLSYRDYEQYMFKLLKEEKEGVKLIEKINYQTKVTNEI